jgi:integrase
MTKVVSGRQGITGQAQFERLKTSVKGLYRRQQDELVRAFFDDRLSAQDVLRAYEQGETNSDFVIFDSDSFEVLSQWATSSHYSEANRELQRGLFQRLEGDLRGVPMASFPRRLLRIKPNFEGRTSQFNLIRTISLSFLRNGTVQGRAGNLYRQVQAVLPYPKKSHRRANNYKPFGVKELDKLLLESKIKPEIQQWIRWLCLHGLRMKELFHDGFDVVDVNGTPAIHVRGKKSDAADRLVPLIKEIPSSTITTNQLRTALSKLGRQRYDCRRTYAQWLQGSGVPRNVMQKWMGHSSVKSVTDVYLQAETTEEIRKWRVVLMKWYDAQKRVDPADHDAVLPPLGADEILQDGLQSWSQERIVEELNAILWRWYAGDDAFLRVPFEVDGITRIDSSRLAASDD